MKPAPHADIDQQHARNSSIATVASRGPARGVRAAAGTVVNCPKESS
jgi:hypothetical protein